MTREKPCNTRLLGNVINTDKLKTPAVSSVSENDDLAATN